MARYTQPASFDFYCQSPTGLDTKAVFSGDEDSVLDDKILDPNTPDISTMNDPRRSSFDQTADEFSQREPIWSDMARHNTDPQSQHPSQVSTPLFEPAATNFVRLDTAHAASYGHQQQAWPLSSDSGSCTPTPIYEHFPTPHDYDGNPASNPFAGGAVGPVNAMSFSQIPYRPGAAFPPPGAVTMSPQSSHGWVPGSSETQEAGAKASRNPPYRAGSSLHMRRDGIRKKNARFDIPAERTLSNIDILISQSTDEDEIKELKQQKRLLRNRQAALDSRQRKKQHTEQLEEEKKQFSSTISGLEDALREMKLREDEYLREKAELLERQEQLHAYIKQLHMDKEEMIRTHTLETGELRKKNNILREHMEKMEMESRQSAPYGFQNEFAPYENIAVDPSPWDYAMASEFPLGPEPQAIARTPTPTPQNSLVALPKKLDKPSEKNSSSQGDFPFSWNAFYMCLLFGAFIASNSNSVSAPAIPPLSDEYRAESANVLKAVLASAGPSEPSQSLNVPNNLAPTSSATTSLPTTISGAEMAQMTSGSEPTSSKLDDLHHNLIAPTREQEEDDVFALSAEQYRALTTLDDDDGDVKPPPSNLQQAYAAMRNNGMQNRLDVKGSQNIHSRSLLWDRVPDKVVRDFQRMVRECGANVVKDENA